MHKAELKKGMSAFQLMTPPWNHKNKEGEGEEDEGGNATDDVWLPIANTKQQQEDRPPSYARATRSWDVQIPANPTKSLVRGYMVPTLSSALNPLMRQERRISLEIHHVGSLKDGKRGGGKGKPSKGSGDGNLSASVDPQDMQRHLRGKSFSESALLTEEENLVEGEYIILRILKPADPTDSATELSCIPNKKQVIQEQDMIQALTPNEPKKITRFHTPDEPDDPVNIIDSQTGKPWTEVTCFDLDDCKILKTKGKALEIKYGRGEETEIREMRFYSVAEAETFVQIIQKLGRLEAQRTRQRIRNYYATHTGENSGKIQIMVEVVSALKLPVADLLGSDSDPYVTVRLGAREVHETKVLSNTVNPIWTIDTDAYFILETTPEEFFASSSGLTFVVKDFNAFGREAIFGTCVVTQEELLEGKGDRKEYQIEFGDFTAEDGSTESGKLLLRYRQARPNDLEFMERLKQFREAKTLRVGGAEVIVPDAVLKAGEAVVNVTKQLMSEEPGVYWEETFVPPTVTGLGPGHKATKTENRKGPKLLRVKPRADPDRPEETKWLTTEQIEAESVKPSTNWTETGSGDLGKLYVEIIGCDDLPNMDAFPLLGDSIPALNTLTGGKTDAFVCLVFEDSIVNTAVINDSLSPRWMPWSQRSFVFHIMHPSSPLMVGVFDFDTELPGAKHDAVGRVSLNVSNMRSNTEYTLYYDLYTSDLSSKRTSQGQIKLRLRKELYDNRKYALAALQSPPQFYINVATFRDYEAARFTCEGKFDAHRFDIDTLTEHVDELQEYQRLLPIIQEAALTVLLWRGHFPLEFQWGSKEITVLLPLHSFSVFVCGVLLAENYALLPSFIMFGIFWLLYTMSGTLSDDPSPWKMPITFVDLSRACAIGSLAPVKIEPFENQEEIEQYQVHQEELEKQKVAAAKKKAALESLERTDADLVAMNAAEEVHMATKTDNQGIQLNPLAPYLFPLQQQLYQVCRVLRITRGFLTWQEPLTAFWICIACLFLGVVFLFIPWRFLTCWTIRIVVWVGLGPWMKLVDIFYVQQTEKDAEEAEAALVQKRLKQLRVTAQNRQLKREEMTKLKSLKRYMFGQYILELPRWKESRYIDIPLMASHCAPVEDDKASKRSLLVKQKKYGQHISVNSIIPEREIQKAATDHDHDSNEEAADDEASKRPKDKDV